jgi:hypothetical protein
MVYTHSLFIIRLKMMYSDCDRVEGEKYGEEGVESCPFTEAKVKTEKIKKSNSTHTVKDDARDDTSLYTTMDELQTELKNRSIFGKTFDKFCTWPYGKLRDLTKGEYDVLALKESVSQYGNKYTMLLYSKKVNISTLRHQFWTNTKIEEIVHSTLPYENKRLVMKNNIICLEEGPVARLNITGKFQKKGLNHPVVCCQFTLSRLLLESIASKQLVEEEGKKKTTSVEVSDDGSDLKEKTMQSTGGKVTRETVTTDFAMYDWACNLKYKDLPWYIKKDNRHKRTRVLGVRFVEHKGTARKVVLTEDGSIFRLRSPKLETYVRAGSMLPF